MELNHLQDVQQTNVQLCQVSQASPFMSKVNFLFISFHEVAWVEKKLQSIKRAFFFITVLSSLLRSDWLFSWNKSANRNWQKSQMWNNQTKEPTVSGMLHVCWIVYIWPCLWPPVPHVVTMSRLVPLTGLEGAHAHTDTHRGHFFSSLCLEVGAPAF